MRLKNIISGILFLLVGVLMVASCKPSTPSEFISSGDMENLLYDYHLADAMASQASGNYDENLVAYRSAVLKKWKRNSPCLWNGKQRPAMARNESFCRLICRDVMMSAACGKLSNFLTVSHGGMKKGKTRRNGL